MPDQEKEWWEEAWDRQYFHSLGVDGGGVPREWTRSIIRESIRRHNEMLRKKLEGMKDFGVGGHGTRCTCSGCKHLHDDCRSD